jgi:hypothetical protein
VYKLLQLLRKLFFGIAFLLAIMLLASTVYFRHYKQEILEQAVSEVAKQLQCCIKVNNLGLTIFASFPKLNLVLHKVVIAHPTEDTKPLLEADKVSCSLDILSFLKGNYSIDELGLEHGSIHWVVQQASLGWLQKSGQQVKKKRKATNFSINLTKLQLKDIQVTYANTTPQANTPYYNIIHIDDIVADLAFAPDQLDTKINGQAVLSQFIYHNKVYAPKLPIAVKVKLSYRYPQNCFHIHASQFNTNLGTLLLEGHYSHEVNGSINMRVKGKQISVKNLWDCWPASAKSYLVPWQIDGMLALDLGISRKAGKDHKTSMQGIINLSEMQATCKGLADKITLGQVKGELQIPEIQNLSTASLYLEEQSIVWGHSAIIGKLKIKNLQELYCTYQGHIKFSLATLAQCWPVTPVTNVGGCIQGNFNLGVNIHQVANQGVLAQALKLEAKLDTEGIRFSYNQLPCSLQDQANSLLLSEQSLLIKNMLGKLGSGSWALQGTLHNWLNLLQTVPSPVTLAGKFYTDFLDVDALVAVSNPQKLNPPSRFTIAPNLEGSLVCDIQELRYKSFRSKQLSGKLHIKDQRLTGKDISLKFAGGQTTVNGFLDTHTDTIHIHSMVKLHGVDAGKLFANFNNFQQDFLKDEHLRGSIFADLVLDMDADQQGQIHWDSLKADMAIQLHEARLLNFPPLQKLSDYIAEEHLGQLRFAALKNHIHIENKLIYIPPMDTYSNITHIQLSGIHSFDGQLNYNLVVPLANLKPQKLAQEIDTMDAETLAGLKLHLKLEGDSKHYQISYDKEALKKDLKNNLQQQGKILKEIFKGQYVAKQRKKELSSGDYFDFE